MEHTGHNRPVWIWEESSSEVRPPCPIERNSSDREVRATTTLEEEP